MFQGRVQGFAVKIGVDDTITEHPEITELKVTGRTETKPVIDNAMLPLFKPNAFAGSLLFSGV